MTPRIFIVILVTIFIRHGIAKKSDVDSGACVFDKYNNDHELHSVERIRGLIGKSFTSQSADGQWQYTVGICTDLKSKLANADSDAGAVQIKSDGKENKVHKIGSLKNVHLMAGRDWAILEYKDGEVYGSHCGSEPKRTVIMLSCDEGVDTASAKMIHIEEENQKQEGCYYLFEMKHKALCPKSTGKVLSVGSVLLITFFSVLALYLIIGFLYQRFVLGSKGKEQIPNYEFWKDLGNLEADGCDFVCRSKGRQTTGFRGIGDDQLDTTEEIRDDNLLPM